MDSVSSEKVSKNDPQTESLKTVPVVASGSERHRYHQNVIRKISQERGLRAQIEYAVDDGFVDVAIFGEKQKVACEVSIGNSSEYELHNVEKCIAAGFDHLVLIACDERKRRALEEHIAEKLTDDVWQKV